MAITRDFGKVVFMCDECDNYHYTDEYDFSEALRLVQHEGWVSLREDTEYSHYCPSCVGDDNINED